MKLSDIKIHLSTLDTIHFQLENGTVIPEHFHITEVGMVSKQFIDCGGTTRLEKVANFQLWHANDVEHRLKPTKLLNIIKLAEDKLGMEDLEIEVEYQSNTVGKYNLEFNGKHFVLVSKQTACLATDSCGIPLEKQKINLSELTTRNACVPGGKCC